MWIYEKKLEYPVKIKTPSARTASIIVSQLGGPDGEMGAAMRYLHQRYACPYDKVTGILTDVGTEELAHLEIVAAILHQLTKNLSTSQIEGSPFESYFVDHTTGVYPVASAGVPFDMKYVGVKGDNILRLVDDPDVRDPIKFLREREIVHYQRFADAIRISQENLNSKNFYACNPSFDKNCPNNKNCRQ